MSLRRLPHRRAWRNICHAGQAEIDAIGKMAVSSASLLSGGPARAQVGERVRDRANLCWPRS